VTDDDERAALGFVAAVREQTGFLADHGLREVAASSYAVDFASDRVRLRIGHDRLSCEISASVARRDGGEGTTGYAYGEYLGVVDPAAAADYRDFAATTPDAVRRGVARLAAGLRVASPLLAGEDATYDELAHHGLLAGERLAANSRRHAYKPRAEAAWQAKDWPAVVAAYARYENDLTEGERRRLELARRRASGTP
jgi:hypothetical protein